MDILRRYKKWIFILVGLLIIVMFGIIMNPGYSSKEKEVIDAFQNFQINFKGIDESGEAEIVDPDILYHGNDEAKQQLFDELVYEVIPNKGLSNGDKVTVKLRFSHGLLDLSNVRFKETEKVFTVSGLASSNRQKIKSSVIVQDKEGNDVEVETEHFLIEGVEIPTYWNLTDEEIQAYVNSVKRNENNSTDVSDSVGVEDQWIQGESKEPTERKSADFLSEWYLDNAITAYNDAYQYGIESSQEFKIKPIIENSKSIGYQCIFKDDIDSNQE